LRPGLTTNWLMVGGTAAIEMDVRGFADYRAIEWRATRGGVMDIAGTFDSGDGAASSWATVLSAVMRCRQSSLPKW
jgi:hypothetical protein